MVAKKLREHLPGIPVHITARGVGGRDIFLSDGDRRRFLAELLELRKAMPFVIDAFCLMSNHIHLLLEAIDHRLSNVMKELLGKHAERTNKTLGRVGALFQRRYDDVPCVSESHYLNAVAYINNNPVRAGLVKDPSDWHWSSHRELVGLADNLFIARDRVLESFGGIDGYRTAAERQPRSEIARISNAVIGPRFDSEYYRDLSGHDLKTFLDELAQDVARSQGLRVEDVVGARKDRRESGARKRFMDAALAADVPISQIARYLGRSAAYVSRQRSSIGV